MIDIELDNLRLALNKKKGKKKTKKTKVKKPRKKKFPGDNVNKSKDPKDLLAGVLTHFIPSRARSANERFPEHSLSPCLSVCCSSINSSLHHFITSRRCILSPPKPYPSSTT